MKKTKGISLIVLVITIIVMIIIAGAIILSLSNTNVIDQAEQAKDKYNLSQLKEAVNLDRTNALLTRYNTTEGVNISVKELLGLTDSDAMELTSTNTMPANMPAGKYYKLDVTKYGMQSAGVVENNTIKGAYVINDNYDIYYVVEGTTSEIAKEIDDARVIELLEIYVENYELTNEQIFELKQKLYIEHLEGEKFVELAIPFYYNGTENIGIYFSEIDRLYMFEEKLINEEREVTNGIYLSKEENLTTYAYAKKLQQIVAELNSVFVGKTETEIMLKYNEGTLDEYIVTTCSSINTVELRDDWNSEQIISSINFESNGTVYDELCEYNTFWFVLGEDGRYIEVYLEFGA